MGIEYQKKKNHPYTGNLSTSMLEIDMFVDKRTKKFTTFLYDERDKFEFPIVKYPSIKSNFHSNTI